MSWGGIPANKNVKKSRNVHKLMLAEEKQQAQDRELMLLEDETSLKMCQIARKHVMRD